MTYHSVVFHYKIKSLMDIARAPKEGFKGKATLYRNPEDGEWKYLKKIRLEDGGSSEFTWIDGAN